MGHQPPNSWAAPRGGAGPGGVPLLWGAPELRWCCSWHGLLSCSTWGCSFCPVWLLAAGMGQDGAGGTCSGVLHPTATQPTGPAPHAGPMQHSQGHGPSVPTAVPPPAPGTALTTAPAVGCPQGLGDAEPGRCPRCISHPRDRGQAPSARAQEAVQCSHPAGRRARVSSGKDLVNLCVNPAAAAEPLPPGAAVLPAAHPLPRTASEELAPSASRSSAAGCAAVPSAVDGSAIFLFPDGRIMARKSKNRETDPRAVVGASALPHSAARRGAWCWWWRQPGAGPKTLRRGRTGAPCPWLQPGEDTVRPCRSAPLGARGCAGQQSWCSWAGAGRELARPRLGPSPVFWG